MEETIYKDIIGQELVQGCCVAIADRNILIIGKIAKLTPKMIRVSPIKNKYDRDLLVYPYNAIRIDGSDAMFYILKHQGE